MNSLVLQCPLCSKPFQVLAEQAGSAVQCPSCKQAVMIPPDLAPQQQIPPPSPTPTDKLVFACPACERQFGITTEMYGQKVGCPHCQSSVTIQTPQQSKPPKLKRPSAKPDPASVLETDLLPPERAPIKIDAANKTPIAKTRAQVKSSKPALEKLPTIVETPPVVEPSSVAEQDERETTTEDNATSQSIASTATETVTAEPEPQNIDHLLPPKFDVIDPERLVLNNRRADDHRVVLPDGEGGLQTYDDRIVNVKHGDQEIKLVALPPHELRRRRQIQNGVFMIGGAILLAIIFALLRKTI